MNGVAEAGGATPDTERARLIEENSRLRNKLLEVAGECAACDGTGVVDHLDPDGRPCRQVPCPDCEDIREVLS